MSKEIRKVAQMLVGISSEYLAGTIEEDIFKVQIEFANDILNKAENLPIPNGVGQSEQLKPEIKEFLMALRFAEDIRIRTEAQRLLRL